MKKNKLALGLMALALFGGSITNTVSAQPHEGDVITVVKQGETSHSTKAIRPIKLGRKININNVLSSQDTFWEVLSPGITTSSPRSFLVLGESGVATETGGSFFVDIEGMGFPENEFYHSNLVENNKMHLMLPGFTQQ